MPQTLIFQRLSINRFRAARKPGSVSGNHLSRRTVTSTLQRPTSRAAAGRRTYCPVLVLLRRGFTRELCSHNSRGALTSPFHPYHGLIRFGGVFLLHFPYSYLRQTLSGILALWSPDFPHTSRRCTRLPELPETVCFSAKLFYYIISKGSMSTSDWIISIPSATFARSFSAKFPAKDFSVP